MMANVARTMAVGIVKASATWSSTIDQGQPHRSFLPNILHPSDHRVETASQQSRQPSTMNHHIINFAPNGTACCLWTEIVPLHELGRLEIQRASTVEFEEGTQSWEVRLTSNPEIVAFEDPSRETCLNWERETLNELL
jgi:hypothetical protein